MGHRHRKGLARRNRYEIWVDGEFHSSYKNRDSHNEYVVLVLLREKYSYLFNNRPFKVYRLVKSKFPPVGTEI